MILLVFQDEQFVKALVLSSSDVCALLKPPLVICAASYVCNEEDTYQGEQNCHGVKEPLQNNRCCYLREVRVSYWKKY